MKRKTRLSSRLLAVVLCLAMLLGLLSGCGGKEEPAAEETPDAPEEVTPVEEEPESGYIPAPYTAEAGSTPTEYCEPVFYDNEDGPTISVVYVGVIQEDGKYFRDSDNDQELDPFEDWRLSTEDRVADLVGKLTQDQRIGLMQNSLNSSPQAITAEQAYNEDGTVNLAMLLTLPEYEGSGDYTSYLASAVTDSDCRSGVIRANTDTETGALFNNALNLTAEYSAVTSGEVTVPFLLISNPMTAGYPSSMGFGAAVTGDGNADMMKTYAELDAEIWDAKGIHQMYGPQIDLITDPRWSRNSTTYTEDPEVMADIATALVEGYQHGTDGIQSGDVGLTVKHFPGDGAAENGFESHNGMGQWRIYATEGSLENYQLVGFQAAIDAGVAGIMPGYSRPATDGRSVTQSYKGTEVNMEEIANAYSTALLTDLLRDTMGFDGFVNTDSGIIDGFGLEFGAEDMTVPERWAAVINAGSDVVGNSFGAPDYTALTEAVTSGLVTEEAYDRATTNRMNLWVDLGMFDNPYRDAAASKAVGDQNAAAVEEMKSEIHHKSVVLMKNHDEVLPLTDTSKTVYLASFTSTGLNDDSIASWTAAIEAAGYTVVNDPSAADIAILDVVPGNVLYSNEFMNVLDLVENQEAEHVDVKTQEKDGTTVEVTTLQDVDDIADIAKTVHSNGGTVIASIDISSPWILTNLEPYCDALIGSFSTSVEARVDVLTGLYAPTGKLPVTMVSCNEVIAVNDVEIDGKTYPVCVSPNDVPGYDKDQYMDAAVLAQSPSGSYAYQDADGNLYVSGFGLSMDVSGVTAPAEQAPAETEEPATEPEETANEGGTTAAPGDEALSVNYEAVPDDFVGTWVLTGAYTADDGMLSVAENACYLDIELSIDANKLVDEAAYTHADAINLSGTMRFDHADISVDDYSCSASWSNWSTVNVIGEGNCEFYGANKLKIRDDDEGVFFDVLAGVEVDELLDIIAVNSDGQLIVGYSDGNIVTDSSATCEYAYIFTKA
ncbi:MAG: glycoside hydrolase family 3 N-terminal domain-containing protein [Candidatus Onthomonas sp.]